MRDELKSAADFLSNMLMVRDKNSNCNQHRQKLDRFRNALLKLLQVHYKEHWFPDRPTRGSGYRCLRINHKMDPIIGKAGFECGFSEEILRKKLPNELTLWIDPREVSYRIGENGSICILYDGNALQATKVIEKIGSSLDNLSLSESEDSGFGSPMSTSPPTPGFERMSTCKSEFRFNINDFMSENSNVSFMDYVAS